MNRRIALHTLRAALAKGATPDKPWSADWDVSGRCLSPVARCIAPRKEQSFRRAYATRLYDPEDGEFVAVDRISHVVYEDNHAPVELRLMVKCRKCDSCLKERQTLWGKRGLQEVGLSSRTWAGTLTVAPQWQEHFANKARLRCTKRGNGVFESHPLADQFLMRHAEINREITKIFKRLRKAGHEFRYLLVVEPHLSSHLDSESEEKGANFGLPHYHILVHEVGAEISKRVLDTAWNYGFTHFRLVDRTEPRAVWYVCKYLGKTSASRVRASLKYGVGRSSLEVAKSAPGVFLRDKTDLRNGAVSELGEASWARGARSAQPSAGFTQTDYLNCSRGGNDVV